MKTVSRYEEFRQFLSKEKEKELFYQMKDGDMDAREELILSHSYMVIKIAREYERYGPIEDLEHEGFIALTKAADVYNIEKGRLRTYAYQSVRLHMLRFLAKNKDFIKLPEPQVRQLLFLMRIKDSLTGELGREPTYEDIMKHPKVVKEYKKYS